MQKPTENNDSMIMVTEAELFDKYVEDDSPFRVVDEVIDFSSLANELRSSFAKQGRKGYDVEKGLRALIIQFWEDYSDRQMEKAVKNNMEIRWFCGFGWDEDTPDHSYFGRLRDRLGIKKIEKVLNGINETLESYGLIGDTFSFVDASAIVTKTSLWKERDQAIKDGKETLDNSNVEEYCSDEDANFGAKSSTNFWFGHKEHTVVDMKHGLITDITSTPANVHDAYGFETICPNKNIVCADKLYDCEHVYNILDENNCQSAIIQKNNRKDKNKRKDKFFSKLRLPFEGTFAHRNKRARYQGTNKVTFQCIISAISYNLKKAAKLLKDKVLANKKKTQPI